ncbi:hypothetical protein CJ010_11050 [Azoarcus sp. DD4]|nr:hypothetical protein CJ010_11050 [Azoarcus sp. DD4]
MIAGATRRHASRMRDGSGGRTGWDQRAEGMALKQSVVNTDAVSTSTRATATPTLPARSGRHRTRLWPGR